MIKKMVVEKYEYLIFAFGVLLKLNTRAILLAFSLIHECQFCFFYAYLNDWLHHENHRVILDQVPIRNEDDIF